MHVRTRMAPSPTGEIHVGSLSILLKDYAFAKKHGGSFVLRIEDTDKAREVPGAVERIMSVIRAYGLSWDEGPDIGGAYGPYTQSERLPIYREHVQKLLEKGAAYHCFCTRERLEQVRADQMANKQQPKYDGHCRFLSSEEVSERLAKNEPSVVRLKVPKDEQINFTDLVRGAITVSSNDIDDQVLLKSDGFPTYHLAVVVDDNAMKISHILRGEEWISSTPKHVLLYRAFGWEQPIFAHVPIFLSPDGKGKMSKRKGDVAAQSFLDQGYLPEAMLNFFMILGWSTHDQREIISLDEYVQEFDPAAISSKSVVFDLKKLAWLNGIYIRKLDDATLLEKLTPFIPANRDLTKMKELLPLVKERLVTLADIGPLTSYFFEDISVDKQQLLIKSTSPEQVIDQLAITIERLENLQDWNVTTLESCLRELQLEKEWHPRQFFMMLRNALTAESATPPLFDTILALDKPTVIKRLSSAQALIKTT